MPPTPAARRRPTGDVFAATRTSTRSSANAPASESSTRATSTRTTTSIPVREGMPHRRRYADVRPGDQGASNWHSGCSASAAISRATRSTTMIVNHPPITDQARFTRRVRLILIAGVTLGLTFGNFGILVALAGVGPVDTIAKQLARRAVIARGMASEPLSAP